MTSEKEKNFSRRRRKVAADSDCRRPRAFAWFCSRATTMWRGRQSQSSAKRMLMALAPFLMVQYGQHKGGAMHPLYEKAHKLTEEVIAAAIAVHKHFGPGVLESIYVRCLEQALKVAGHTVEREKTVSISYMGTTFEEKLRCDLLVDDCLIIEAKSIEPCDLQRFRMQLLSYMKLLDKPLGLVMNFGEERFGQRGIRRVILKNADAGFDPFKS